MSDETNANLPVLIRMQGGTVARVLGWDQHLVVLNQSQQMQVAMMVQMYPGLDTEMTVDLLAEAAGHFGEELDRWFGTMVEHYGIETVYLAIEMMDHLSLRTSGGQKHVQSMLLSEEVSRSRADAELIAREEERFTLDEMLGVLEALGEAGCEVNDLTRFEIYMDRLGGWSLARLLDPGQVAALLSGEIDPDDLREQLDAPSDSPE